MGTSAEQSEIARDTLLLENAGSTYPVDSARTICCGEREEN